MLRRSSDPGIHFERYSEIPPRSRSISSALGLCFAVLLTCLLTLTALGQQTTGNLSGNVNDPTGAIVAGATVTLKNSATGEERKATTGDQGGFSFQSVGPGTYSIIVEATGFKRTQAQNIVVEVSKQANVTITLEVGAVSETVTVLAAQDIINTISPTLSNVINTRQVQDLPLPSRNPLDLAALQAGIAVTGTGTRTGSVGGLRGSATNVTQDGINAMDNFVKTDALFAVTAPSLNSISEFSITVGTVGSDSGRGVAQVRLVTSSGSNDFHGSAFMQIRNDVLEANNFFNNLNGTCGTLPCSQRPRERQSYFGFNAGGPMFAPKFGEGGKSIWDGHDKAFWFFSYEGFREPFSVTRNRTVLTAPARTGLFSYVGANGATTTVNLLALGNFHTLNPLTTAQINKMPLPNNTLRGDGLNTAGTTFNVGGSDPSDSYAFRYDHQLVEQSKLGSHKLEFVLNKTTTSLFPDTFNQIESPFPGGIDAGQASKRWLTTIALHSIFGSATNEVRWGRQWAPVSFLRAAPPEGAFFIALGSVTSFDNSFMSQGRTTTVSQLTDNFSLPKGSHTFRMGADYQQVAATTFNDAGINPTITIGTNSSNPDGIVNANFPNLPAGSTGSAIVTRAQTVYRDLVGLLQSASATFNVTSPTSGFVQGATRLRLLRERDLALYFEDQWRWKSNVTLNYGVRWDYEGVPVVPDGVGIQVTNVNDIFGISGANNLFNPNAPAGPPPAKATLDFVSGKTGRGLYRNDWNNFAPYFGFAYSPDFKSGVLHRLLGSQGTSSIRGGYSISYLKDGFTVISNALGTGVTNPGLIQSSSVTTPVGVLAGPIALTKPAFAIPITDKTNFDLSPVNGLWAINPNLRIPYVQQWSLGIEREITSNMALEVRYVGNHAIKVFRAADFNEVNIFENGFLNEFLNAQKNLAINGGTSFAPGAAGTVPLPILAKFFTGVSAGNGFASSGFISNLNNNNVGSFANTLAFSNTYKANRQSAAIGIPANFFVANPNAAFALLLDNSSMSNYHSLQVEFRRRFAHGLQFQADYTFSKSMTDAAGAAGSQSDNANLRTLRNPGFDYVRSNQNQTHRFVFNSVFDLPIGSGRHFMSSAHGVVNKLIGGWTIGSIVTWQGRPPFTITQNRSTFNCQPQRASTGNGCVVGTNPAQLVGISFEEFKKNLGVFRTPSGLFFVNPAILDIKTDPVTGKFVSSTLKPGLMSVSAPGRFGNFPTNAISGPHYFNADFTIVKRIPITERVKIEFTTTFINAFNHANFVYSGNNFDATNFGQITSTSGNPRIIHFYLGLKW